MCGGETFDCGDEVRTGYETANEQVGSEFVMAYCVLQFIDGVRKIISQLVCAECNKTSAFVDVCEGGCCC